MLSSQSKDLKRMGEKKTNTTEELLQEIEEDTAVPSLHPSPVGTAPPFALLVTSKDATLFQDQEVISSSFMLSVTAF